MVIDAERVHRLHLHIFSLFWYVKSQVILQMGTNWALYKYFEQALKT